MTPCHILCHTYIIIKLLILNMNRDSRGRFSTKDSISVELIVVLCIIGAILITMSIKSGLFVLPPMIVFGLVKLILLLND